jgi:hypothetical protein
MIQIDDVLANRCTILRSCIRRGVLQAPHQVRGFVIRAAEKISIPSDEPSLAVREPLREVLKALNFGGYPTLAYAGYCIGCALSGEVNEEVGTGFLRGIDRQCERSSASQAQLAGDAIALLGIADGLRAIERNKVATEHVERAKDWVLDLIEQHAGSDIRINRARLLAGDFLDGQGRFGLQLAKSDEPVTAALDICLWRVWPDVLKFAVHPGTERRRLLFSDLLILPAPTEGEVLRATIWLSALNVLINEAASATIKDAHQVVRILELTQSSFRRWRWEQESTRKRTAPTRWLIDKEADVQAFLLAILSPYFGDDLRDEQYLQGFGLRQGRFDFAIASLRLIVEVKILRTHKDVDAIEAQVEDDLAIYFKDTQIFDTMIVYIYDDRDKPEPEKYFSIKNALKSRSKRILEVIIIRRPSMIPNRTNRGND